MIPILDAGHGGLINGDYQTAGKRSPNWEQGILYEGMFNRWVMNRVIEKLDRLRIPYFVASPEYTDTSLKTRVNRVNQWAKDHKVYLISIHANAGGGEGIEIFTSKGHTKSDDIAQEFIDGLELDAVHPKFRKDLSDGDGDKESQFYILRKTICPAILIEAGFMDNPEDYALLWDKDYLEDLVESLVASIEAVYGYLDC